MTVTSIAESTEDFSSGRRIMNFLRSIGKKLSEVSEDFNQNLSQLKLKASASFDGATQKLSGDERPPDPRHPPAAIAGAFLLSGGDLLSDYQRHWAEIRRGNEAVGCSVDRVGRLAALLAGRARARAAAWSALQREAADLPRTLASLECIGALVDSLEQRCREVEHELALLENQAEWGQLRRSQHAHNYQLLEHSRRRAEELEKRRVQLAQRHASRVRALEQSRQSSLLERQRAFEQEFQRDMEFFKEHGRTEREPSVSSQTLADVADLPPPLDDAEEALDEFLDAPNDDDDGDCEGDGEAENEDGEAAVFPPADHSAPA